MTTLKMPSLRLRQESATLTTQLINGNDDEAGIIFAAPKTGNITKIHANFGAKTGTVAIRASIQGVAAAARTPDGTIAAAGAAHVTADPSASAWHTFTLGTAAAVTLGDMVAAVLDYPTAPGGTDITVNYAASSTNHGGPYAFVKNNGSYSAPAISNMPIVAVEYDDGTVVGVAATPSSIASSWTSSADPLIKGTKWTPAVACDIDGIWINFLRVADAFDFAVEVYQAGSGTPIFTDTFEGDRLYATSGAVQTVFVPTGVLSLAAGTAYRFTIRPTTANAPSTAILMTFMDATTFAAAVGGSEWAYTTNNAQDDSWTDTANAFAAIFPRVVAVAGSSGGLLGPNMRGFFQ